MKFSVIIVNYASWPLTLRCIESLQQTRYGDFEIFVVDNDRVEPPELPSWVRLIRNKENIGFARAHNRGIAASSGDSIVLINPDTLVERDFFEHLEAFVSENPKAGIFGPKIVDSEGHLQLSARREISALSGFLGRTSLLTRLLHKSAFLYHRKHGVHGPLGAYSAMVLAGLALRALAKLGNSLFAR